MLLTRRTDNGRWCLPGERLEAGESVAEACAREVWEQKFKGDWERARREAQRKPDAEAKLVLLDTLEQRLVEDNEYLDDLDEERSPEPEDYARAERWFEKERVSTEKAW